MLEEMVRMSSLIDGSLYMPIIYNNDFQQAVTRPAMKLERTGEHYNEPVFVAKLNEFLNQYLPSLSFLDWVNSKPVDIVRDNWLRRLIESKFKESNLEGDPTRYQLALLARSIVESYEIMTVLGVSRAVSYLNDVIERAVANNAKNRVINQQEIACVERLRRSVQSLTGESEKLKTLVTILKSEDSVKATKNQSRVLVFVKKRVTALIIKDFLCEIDWVKREWNPEYFTGHGSGDCVDGMSWVEDQAPRLEDFNAATCRLLVATNVLQEGLDVAACNKVIIFDPLHSLTGLK
jgi:ERCC4-related helicase